MAKEYKRKDSKDFKDKKKVSSGEDKRKKKSSFERYRDESRPSDFDNSEPKINSTRSFKDNKRKPFGDKSTFRKKPEMDNFTEEKFKKEKPLTKKNYDDDFYESRPTFVRDSDKKRFDFDDTTQVKRKNKSSYSDYKKRGAEGNESYKNSEDNFETKKTFSGDRDKKSSNNFSKTYKKRPYEKKSFVSKSPSKPEKINDDGSVRLNKYIANAGICSRREADDLISSGVIQVNGKVITEMGFKIKPTDIIKYGGQTLKKERLVYLILNKPKDYITTIDDPQQRKTVLELVQNACKERIYPVGRLDRATTGLLMFTNDGELTKKLTHPRYGVRKIYHVELDKPLKRTDFDMITEGFELEDGPIKVDEISYVGDGKDKSVVGVEIHSGRNRIVRRIFEHLGYNVRKLDRVVFGPLTKKDMPRGRWRFLTEAEIGMLKMISAG